MLYLARLPQPTSPSNLPWSALTITKSDPEINLGMSFYYYCVQVCPRQRRLVARTVATWATPGAFFSAFSSFARERFGRVAGGSIGAKLTGRALTKHNSYVGGRQWCRANNAQRSQCICFVTLYMSLGKSVPLICAPSTHAYIHVWEAKPFTFSNEQFSSSTSSKAFPLTLALSHQLNGPPLLTIVLSQPNVAHALV